MRMSDLIAKFQLDFPQLVEDMEKSTHHYSRQHLNPFHREGNVYGHVLQVCLMTEVLKVNYLVKIACLLHDLAKPMCTQIDDEFKKVKMYGHEGASVFLGLKFLNSLDLSIEDKVMVCQLISMHTTLFKMMRGDNFESNFVSKFKGSPELVRNLIDMSACDSLGRFALEDEKRDFWMEAKSNLEHLVYKCERYQTLQAKDKIQEALILVGPPLSGKTSWVKKHCSNYLVLSRDQVILDLGKGKPYDELKFKNDDKVDREYNLRKLEASKSGRNLVFDLTHMSPKSRRRSLGGLPKDIKKIAIVFLTPLDMLEERNLKRSKDEKKTIPRESLLKMIKNFEMPLPSEGFDEIRYIFN